MNETSATGPASLAGNSSSGGASTGPWVSKLHVGLPVVRDTA